MIKDKIALVTGGSRGIGAEIVKGLASKGYYVFINYNRNGNGAKRVLAELEVAGHSGELVQANVSNFDEVKSMVDGIIQSKNKIDVLINNAGITKQNLLCDVSNEEYDNIMNVNIKGVFNLCKATYSNFTSLKNGTIVNISSTDGLKGNSCEAVYSASKGAVIAFSKALKAELSSSNINVCYICPGATDTDMLKSYGEATYNYIKKNGKVVSPKNVARKVLKLIK